jgi:hypothetical protein
VNKKLLIVTAIIIFGVSACSHSNDTATASATQPQTPATRPGTDNSEITTATDASGTKTETRVFRDNKRVSRVVVTTRNGNRTVRAYSPSGEEKDLKDETVDALEATGEKVADAAGFVADKGEDVAGEAKDGAKAVGEKVADKAEDVADKTKEGATTVKDKTVEGAKTVGSKTKEGVKKAGKAVKKIIP